MGVVGATKYHLIDYENRRIIRKANFRYNKKSNDD